MTRAKLGVIILAGLAIISATTLYGLNAQATEQYEDWPAFTMVYTLWAPDLGPNHSPGKATYRVEYKARDNWRFEILHYDGYPEIEGTWSEYDGNSLTSYDASFDHLTQTPAPKDGHYAVTRWLIPHLFEHRAKTAGWVQSITDNGNIIIEGKEQFNGRTILTRATLDHATGIPIEVEYLTDGAVTKTISVEILELH